MNESYPLPNPMFDGQGNQISDIEKIAIKFLRLHPGAVIPEYSTAGAACFDMVATMIEKVIGDENLVTIHFGFATEIPLGFKAVMVPRSGFTKTNWILQNSPCQIDSDYRGEWMMKMRALPNRCFDTILRYPVFPFNVGDRVAQAYIERVIKADFTEVQSLDTTQRGAGGFGSTGK